MMLHIIPVVVLVYNRRNCSVQILVFLVRSYHRIVIGVGGQQAGFLLQLREVSSDKHISRSSSDFTHVITPSFNFNFLRILIKKEFYIIAYIENISDSSL